MRDNITSPRVEIMKRKRKLYKIRLSILFFVLFVALIYTLSYFSSHEKITLQNVVIEGTSVVSAKDLESRVQLGISGKYLYLFSKSNSFIYPRKYLESDLIKQFPRIEKITISRDNLRTLNIKVTERSGSYLYCGSKVPEMQTDVGENCYFLNENGYIFDKAPYFSGNIYFKYYSNTSESNLLGSQIFSTDRFHLLNRFVEGVSGIGFKPIYMVIMEDGDHNLYLDHEKSLSTPKIMFKADNDLHIILENLALAMKKPEFANEINSKYATLSYIDLRFDNKVVYKFQ